MATVVKETYGCNILLYIHIFILPEFPYWCHYGYLCTNLQTLVQLICVLHQPTKTDNYLTVIAAILLKPL